MTEIEKKAEEYVLYIPDTVNAQHSVYSEEKLKQAYKDGYEQGQKENELLKSKIKNVYEVRQKVQSEIIIELEIEIEELKKAIVEKNSVIDKMKEDIRTEIIRHSNLTENTLAYLLNKWELAE